jgi:hypothetical protein
VELSDAHLREIGRISVNFNRIEALVHSFIWALVDAPNEKAQSILTVGDNFSGLLEKLKRLIPICIADAELRGHAQTWVRFARNANDIRINAIHSSWVPSPGDEEKALVLRMTKSGVLGGSASAVDLRRQADLIGTIADEGVRLLQDIVPDFLDETDRDVP